jgi:adenylate cyclase
VEPRIQLTSIDVIASALDLPELGSRVSSPDGAITLMLSDIADAGAAAEQLGERWESMLRDHHALVEQLVAHHDGQIVKRESDGFFASFNSAHAALHGAVELQRTFTGSAPGGERPLALRVGLHTGFVIGGDQLMGRNVVLAARIANHAKPGEILVSSIVRQYTAGDPRFRFEERGEFHFKGLHGEHVVFAVDWR